MNLISIIRSIEELIVEVMLWFIIIPKTMAKILTSPGWAVDYVVAELARPADQRFDEYLSPVMLWLLVAVVPYFWAMQPLRHLFSDDLYETVFVFAVLLGAGPLGFATGALAARKQSITRTSLKTLFYGQCYCFTPAFLLSLPFAVLVSRGDRVGLSEHPFVGGMSIGVALLWLFVSEILFLMRHVQISWLRAAALFVPFLFASYMVAWASISAALLIFVALHAMGGG